MLVELSHITVFTFWTVGLLCIFLIVFSMLKVNIFPLLESLNDQTGGLLCSFFTLLHSDTGSRKWTVWDLMSGAICQHTVAIQFRNYELELVSMVEVRYGVCWELARRKGFLPQFQKALEMSAWRLIWTVRLGANIETFFRSAHKCHVYRNMEIMEISAYLF